MGGSILVVDDDPDALEYLETILSSSGHHVATAGSGAGALEILERSPVDMVITDLQMPKMDGRALLSAIKHTSADCPVLLVSASGSIPIALELVKAGAEGFLEKPVKPDALISEVDGILAKSRRRTESGHRLGRFTLVRQLGAGGMGAVWEAIDPKLDRRVALKLLHPQPGLPPTKRGEISARFSNEAHIAAGLTHANIAAVHDFGESEDGALYMVMELIRGTSLSAMLSDGGPMHAGILMPLVRQVAEALAYAHHAGVIHRDIKPANVMVSDGVVKLVDFGVAKVPDQELTADNMVMGSPSYVSPEAAYADKLDYRSDQFSLGTLIVEMLTGDRPFAGKSVMETMMKVINKPSPMLSDYGLGLSPRLQAFVTRLHEKKADARFADEQQLLAELDAIIAEFDQ